MFTKSPDATPFWLLIIFAAIFYFGYPRIKRFVSKYSSNKNLDRLWAILIILVIEAVVVTLTVIIGI